MYALLAALLTGLAVKPMCLWIRVRYLRHVYDTGGTRDLKTAAYALACTESRYDSSEPPPESQG